MLTLLRALVYAVFFIGFWIVFLPGQLLQRSVVARPSHVGVFQVAGAVLVALGGALVAWCILTFVLAGRGTPAPFDPPRRLVASGPYRFVRNPMYWGAGLVLLGMAAFHQSLALAGYALFCLGIVHLFVLGYEEPTLRKAFGADYEAYCRRVPRWWPVRPAHPIP